MSHKLIFYLIIKVELFISYSHHLTQYKYYKLQDGRNINIIIIILLENETLSPKFYNSIKINYKKLQDF